MRFGGVAAAVVGLVWGLSVVGPLWGGGLGGMSLKEGCKIYAPAAVFVKGNREAEAFRLIAELITINRSQVDGTCFCATREMKWPEIFKAIGPYQDLVPGLSEDGKGSVTDSEIAALQEAVDAGADEKAAYCGEE